MTFSTQDISVIICAYTEERWDDLCAAVASIHNQTLQPREIIVVVDHNPILLARARAEIARVTVIENSEQRGLSGARNSGIRVAQGDIIAFMDEDAVAEPDWLACLTPHYADPDVIGVGGAIEPRWQHGRPHWFPKEFDWVVGCTYRGMPQGLTCVRNVIGCNMSLRREVVNAVGGFRIGRVGKFSIGQENDETELCIRLGILLKSRILFQPVAMVCHTVRSERATWAYFVKRCYSEGLSKYRLSQLVGGKSLNTERSYALRVLPQGVAMGLKDVLDGDLTGLARAGAILAGLLFTTLGYVIGKTADRFTYR